MELEDATVSFSGDGCSLLQQLLLYRTKIVLRYGYYE